MAAGVDNFLQRAKGDTARCENLGQFDTEPWESCGVTDTDMRQGTCSLKRAACSSKFRRFVCERRISSQCCYCTAVAFERRWMTLGAPRLHTVTANGQLEIHVTTGTGQTKRSSVKDVSELLKQVPAIYYKENSSWYIKDDSHTCDSPLHHPLSSHRTKLSRKNVPVSPVVITREFNVHGIA